MLTEAKPEQISEIGEETSTVEVRVTEVKVRMKKQKQAKAKPALKVSGTRLIKVKEAPLRLSSLNGDIVWNYLEHNTERKDITSNMETAETKQVRINPTSKVLGTKFIKVKEAPVKMKETKETAPGDLESKTVARKDIASHCEGLHLTLRMEIPP